MEDFIFLPNVDSYGYDYGYCRAPVEYLKQMVLENRLLVGFNTLGYIKFAIDTIKQIDYGQESGGLYIHKKRYDEFKKSIIDVDPSVFTVYEYDGMKKQRLGEDYDGGYVIVRDDKINYDLIIGCGIETKCLFEKELSIIYPDVPVFCFDGTIDTMPKNNIKNLTFFKKNISSENTETTTNLSEEMKNYNNIFLKIDIEGHEWEFFKDMKENDLDKFSQIVIELHSVIYNHYVPTSEKMKIMEKILEHFVIVHAHANNNEYSYPIKDSFIPNALELTLVNKKHISNPIKKNTRVLPSSLDMPGQTHKPDINLNFYPFVNN